MNVCQQESPFTTLTDPREIDALIQSPARLAAVLQTGLLDSQLEKSFDSLTQLAARLLSAPSSFVSVIDEKRDFYKSQVGFPEELAAARQYVGRSFCHFTLASDEPLVIEDTHSNPVWKAVPTVQTQGVRAYIGVPLKVHGETVGSFCVIDVNVRRWTSDELETLKQLALSISRELNLRAALVQALDASIEARAHARSRDELIALVAHDLRTPIQILNLSTANLKRDAKEGSQALTETMAAAIKALKDMAESLLSDNAHSSSAGALPQPVSVAVLANDAAQMMHPIAEHASITVVVAALADARVTVDYGQMLRVLGNLIGNAIKYSPAGSVVTVSATRDAENALITVADNGLGMTPEEQIKAFDQGWQGGQAMVRGDGAGLGLGIVKRLVEAHGGHVSLVSQASQGTAMTVCLPCF
jgi:K+-sensing histidine kinase KdpD